MPIIPAIAGSINKRIMVQTSLCQKKKERLYFKKITKVKKDTIVVQAVKYLASMKL
jgi:hypothetical protein